jgi:hypothetical protein
MADGSVETNGTITLELLEDTEQFAMPIHSSSAFNIGAMPRLHLNLA